VRTDRRRYQADEQVLLTVEAYDREFQPLAEEAVPGGVLRAQLVLPETGVGQTGNQQPLSIPLLRKGVFETHFPVFAAASIACGCAIRLRSRMPKYRSA